MFFHMFSNGGGFTYSYMLAELTLQHRQFDIRGTIFDSAPAPRELGSYFRALLNIFESYSGYELPYNFERMSMMHEHGS